jgi:voltage-gated potassium channel
MTWGRPAVLISALVSVIVSGTVFFHLVEGWSLLDSYFFTVVTLSTVGYGSLVPATALGKIGTTIFIFTGIGIFAVAIQQFGEFTLRRRMRKRAQRIEESQEAYIEAETSKDSDG